jgi:hypothetical protein
MSAFLLGCQTDPVGSRAWDAPLKFEADEQIITEVPANLVRGVEAVGGRLMITNRRLLFQPHKINIQTWQTEILLRDVTQVGTRRMLGLVPNGMFIRTRDGDDYKFVVNDRKKLIWIIRSEAEKL